MDMALSGLHWNFRNIMLSHGSGWLITLAATQIVRNGFKDKVSDG